MTSQTLRLCPERWGGKDESFLFLSQGRVVALSIEPLILERTGVVETKTQIEGMTLGMEEMAKH